LTSSTGLGAIRWRNASGFLRGDKKESDPVRESVVLIRYALRFALCAFRYKPDLGGML